MPDLPYSAATQEEAAEAYDIAAIKFRGLNAITNFEMNRYDVKSILDSATLPVGPAAKRLKEASQDSSINTSLSSQLTEGISSYGWPSTIAFQQMQPLNIHYPYGYQHSWCKQEEDSSAITGHNFHETSNFQQPPIYHNVITSCSPSLELGMGMGSDAYNAGVNGLVQTNEGSSRNFFGDEGKQLGVANIFGWPDSYRNPYYAQGVMKMNDYDQQSSDHCAALMEASAQSAQTHGDLAVCHGVSPFTVWNES